ncbi:MAG: glycoside hydrolase family 3 N-terminal domain-containing protein [Bacteroidota bacterium]|nr:glycoside hydrolase family 3 N-terminal domain-containing protein [Bacteroidota bacterium]
MLKINKRFTFILLIICFAQTGFAQTKFPFRDTSLSYDQRIKNLLQTLTLEEKISLLGYVSPGIDRLQIPAYNWWNEALHGLARSGEATVFPQAIGMAASFNTPLLNQVASAISTEGRAKYNVAIAMDRHNQYMGLNFWTPNINIFRDPRWGRGQETYGEDPFLTANMGVAFIKGLQGDDPHFLKTAACAKHFAAHSGPEALRHSFNAVVDEKDLRETYLYAFKKLIDAGVESVMCGYNRLNGEPCCTGNTLLQDILRKEWKFDRQVVTDCWALDDIWARHKTIPTRVEVAAAAVRAGVNMDCANILQEDVMKAINQKLLTPASVDSALYNTLKTEMKLGLLDSSPFNKYASYGQDSINNAAHMALARKAATQTMVLLKNNGVLPIAKEKYPSMLVTGVNSASVEALVGNYHGINGNLVTFTEGIAKAAGPGCAVQYDQGCDNADTLHFGGIWASQCCDLTVAVIGLSPLLEGEEGDAFLSQTNGDKTTLSLPEAQILFMKKLRAAHNKPIIAVVTSGSAVDVTTIEPYCDAMILAWYPGEQGGNALADILFGRVSPSGRLPLTFYKSVNDLPDFTSYAMQGRTYRYFKGTPAYPFGYGLSYTKFDYEWAQQPKEKYTVKDSIQFSVTVKNVGNYTSDEVLQAYIEYPGVERMPLKELKAFKKQTVEKGGSSTFTLSIPVADLQKWDLKTHKWKIYNGQYSLCIGKNSAEYLLKKVFVIK